MRNKQVANFASVPATACGAAVAASAAGDWMRLRTLICAGLFLLFGQRWGQSLEAAEPIAIPSALLTIVESVQVSAARGGVLAEVGVREGQIVESHAPIASLESAKARLAIDEAKLELQLSKQTAADDVDVRYARKTLEQAENELARSLAINEQLPGTISERELDYLRLAVERAKLEIERAEHEHDLSLTKVELQEAKVDQAKLDLAEHNCAAPIGGMLVSIDKRAGEWVEPGESIARIVRIDRIRAEGLLKADAAQFELIGRQAKLVVEVAGGRKIEVTGKVTFVSPEANPVNGMVRIWAEFDRGDGALRPGLRGVVHILGEPHAE